MGFAIHGTVQHAAIDTSGTGASGDVDVTITVSAGDLVVLVVKYEGTATTCSVARAAGGDTFSATPGGVSSWVTPDPTNCQVFYLIGPANTGSQTYRATLGAARPFRSVHVRAFTPDAGETVSFDVEASGNGTAPGSEPATGTFTTTGTDEVVVAVIAEDSGNALTTPTIGGVAADESYLANNDPNFTGSFSRILTATASNITANATYGAISANWAITAAAFKSVAGGSTPKTASETVGAGMADTAGAVRALITATEASALVLIDTALTIGSFFTASDGAAVTLGEGAPSIRAAFAAAEALATRLDDGPSGQEETALDIFDLAETPLSTKWLTQAGLPAGIKSNGVIARGGDASTAVVTGSVWKGNDLPRQHFSEVLLASMGGLGGPTVRGSDFAPKGYWLRAGGDTPTSWTLRKQLDSAPTFSQIAAGTWPVACTDTSSLRLSVVDGAITMVAHDHDPAPPSVYITTDYVLPGGAVTVVHAGDDLQAKINAASPGDILVLDAGATFTGNYSLPNKGGSTYIYIISSALASLPEGVRVNPSVAASMPKIVSANTSPAITCAAGAHHYRFAGIEIATTHAVRTSTCFSVVELNPSGGDATVASDDPHHIVLDRCYVHGTTTGNIRRGVLMNGATCAVIECYVAEIHEVSADNQAIACWNSPGPLKITNSYLEAAGENVLFGGVDPKVTNRVPSDIEFRENYCYKQLSWRVGDASYAGIHWTVKNSLELKNARRMTISGNTFDRVWGDAQNGYAILFTVRNQDATAPWSTVEDIAFTRNVVTHVGGGLNMGAVDNLQSAQTQARILVQNNVWDITGSAWGGTGRWIQIADGGVDYVIDHNAAFHDNDPILFTNSVAPPGTILKAVRLIVTNNICQYINGIIGDYGLGSNNDALAAYATSPTVTKNALVGGTSVNFPTGNFFPADLAAVGFLNINCFPDVVLAASSTFAGAAGDGKDVGVAYPPAVFAVSCDGRLGTATSGSLTDPTPWYSGRPGIDSLGDNVLYEAWAGGASVDGGYASDAARVLAMLSAIEALPIQLQEQVVAKALILAADALGISLTDAGAQQTIALIFITASDTAPVALTDAGLSMLAKVGAQETLAAILVDIFTGNNGTTIGINASDRVSVLLGFIAPTLVQIVASDVARIALVDAGVASVLGPAVIKAAQDGLGLILADLAALGIEFVIGTGESPIFSENLQTISTGIFGSDTLAPKLADVGVVQIIRQLISGTDAAALTLGEVANIFARLASDDALAPQVADAATRLLAVAQAADVAGLSLADAGAILVASLVSVLASDTLAAQAIEVAATVAIVMMAIVASDSAALNLDETGSIFVSTQSLTASESLPVGFDEDSNESRVMALVLGLDGASPQFAELARTLILQGLVPIFGAEGLGVGMEDSAISTILGLLLDIRSDDSVAVVAPEGLAQIQALIAGADAVEVATFDLGAFSVVLNLLPGRILVATVTYVSPVRTAEVLH